MTAITQTREHFKARMDQANRKALQILLVIQTSKHVPSTTGLEIGIRWLTLGGLLIGAIVDSTR